MANSNRWFGVSLMVLGILLALSPALNESLSDLQFTAGIMFGMGLMSL